MALVLTHLIGCYNCSVDEDRPSVFYISEFMNTDQAFRIAAWWGVCAIGTIFASYLIDKSLIGIKYNTPYVASSLFIVREIVIMLFAFSFSAHLWGYTYFNRRFGMRGVAVSANISSILVMVLATSILLVQLALISNSAIQSQVQFLADLLVLIGNTAAIGIIVSLVCFNIFLLLSYKRFGWWAVASIGITAFPYVYWQPWPMIFLLPPSIYFLLHISRTKYFGER
jgi:hypothetical protein